MLILRLVSRVAQDFTFNRQCASRLANRLGIRVEYEHNGLYMGGANPEHPEDPPKFRYGSEGALLCDRQICGLAIQPSDGYGPGYFIGESMNRETAKVIAEALGGDFIDGDEFTEVF